MFTPPAPEPDLCARHRGRRELRPGLLQPADRSALRERGRQPDRIAGGRRAGYFSAFDPTTGELVWQKTFDGLRPGRVGRHGGRPRVRRHRQQHRRLLLRLRRQDRRGAVEVQHRRRRVLVAVGLHGQRRAVRHGRHRAAASAAGAAAI